ncbi:hypothetical protein HDU76_011564, partial [Blyttiomyces sp. JEL0837]
MMSSSQSSSTAPSSSTGPAYLQLPLKTLSIKPRKKGELFSQKKQRKAIREILDHFFERSLKGQNIYYVDYDKKKAVVYRENLGRIFIPKDVSKKPCANPMCENFVEDQNKEFCTDKCGSKLRIAKSRHCSDHVLKEYRTYYYNGIYQWYEDNPQSASATEAVWAMEKILDEKEQSKKGIEPFFAKIIQKNNHIPACLIMDPHYYKMLDIVIPNDLPSHVMVFSKGSVEAQLNGKGKSLLDSNHTIEFI